MLSQTALHYLKTFLIKTAHQAGQIQKKSFRRLQPAQSKSAWGDLVTGVDRSAERLIIKAIQKNYPHDSILTEESGHQANDNHRLWLVDPLDGTLNYMTGIPFFSVAIFCLDQKSMVAGVVHDPIHRETFVSDGRGVYLNNQPIKINQAGLKQAWLATELPPVGLATQVTLTLLPKIIFKTRAVKSLGSTALELAYVAAGRLSGFFSKGVSQPWDIAPAFLIEQAGGQVTDWQGRPWSINSKSLLATNGKIHNDLLNLLRPGSQ